MKASLLSFVLCILSTSALADSPCQTLGDFSKPGGCTPAVATSVPTPTPAPPAKTAEPAPTLVTPVPAPAAKPAPAPIAVAAPTPVTPPKAVASDSSAPVAQTGLTASLGSDENTDADARVAGRRWRCHGGGLYTRTICDAEIKVCKSTYPGHVECQWLRSTPEGLRETGLTDLFVDALNDRTDRIARSIGGYGYRGYDGDSGYDRYNADNRHGSFNNRGIRHECRIPQGDLHGHTYGC